MSTTATDLLPAIIQPLSNLPNELIEGILTRLPVSAIIELSIVEDKMLSREGRLLGSARGFFSARILGSLGWKAVFPNRLALIDLRLKYEYVIRTYELVYRRRYSHALVRSDNQMARGIKQHAFRHLRRLLSMHTRQLGPWHRELLSLRTELDEEHHRFVRTLWFSLERDWHFYMSYPPSSMMDKTDVHVPREWRFDWIGHVNSPPIDVRQKRLEFMVTIQRYYKDLLGEEINLLSSLIEQHPNKVKQLRDGREQPRPNIKHITDRFTLDAQLVSNLQFASRRKRTGSAKFNDDRLPLIPLDKWMWFFLESRSNMNKLGSVSPPEVAKDVDTVMRSIAQVCQDYGPPIPRLVARSQDRTLGEGLPGLPSTDELERSLVDGSCLRPIFTSPSKPHVWWRPEPHFKEEIEWLKAFLRCCDYFAEAFPDLLEKIEQEARQTYLPCPLAE